MLLEEVYTLTELGSIESQIKQLRENKVFFYNKREQLQKELVIARRNNTGCGVILLQIDDVNNQLKMIDEKLKVLYQKYNQLKSKK